MRNKTFELIKKYRIGIKELENPKMSLSLLYKIRSGKTPLKPKHLPYLVVSLNDALKVRGIEKIITMKELYITPQQELDQLIDESLKDKSIYSKEKQEKIDLFKRKKEVHSLKYQYIIAKHNQKIGETEKALRIYYDLLNNFSCSAFFYSILIEITRLEKLEFVYEIYLKYQKKIDKAPYKVKVILFYNIGVSLFETKKYSKAVSFFKVIIAMEEITKYYYYSYNNLGICYQNLGEYEKAIECFQKTLRDPSNYHDLEICYTNIISCAKEMNDKKLLIVNINKLENTLEKLKDEILYQTYWSLGLSYLYLGEKEKAINAFKKEISFPLNLNHRYFNSTKYLDSIKQLVLLYGPQPLKQQELIKIICKIPKRIMCYEFSMEILKFYLNNSLKNEANLLIQKIQL